MAALSGQITVTTAGTAERGPAVGPAYSIGIKAHPDNADTVWAGNDGAGDVSASNGFPLNPGEGIVATGDIADLRLWWFDADSSGDKICWAVLSR